MSTIKNSMNNCFLNSIVQLLTSSFDIQASFLKPVYQTLFRGYAQKTVINVNELMVYYKERLQSWIVFGEHQDAHESLGYILDDADDKLSFEIQIDQICTYANEVSKSSQKENILLVPLMSSIQESIDAYFKPEDSYEYEENGKKYTSPKIEKNPGNTPDYLFITTLRMKTSMDNGYYRQVKIHKEIEVSSYITYGNKKYKPIAYIMHRGDTQSGHYNTIKLIDNEWTIFDDENKLKIDNQSLGLNFQSGAYIFLYQKDDTIVGDPIIYKPPSSLDRGLPKINLLNSITNNKDEDIIDIDVSIKQEYNKSFYQIFFQHSIENVKDKIKDNYFNSSDLDKEKFINSIKHEVGNNFTNEDLMMYFSNREDPEYFNPLIFPSIYNVGKLVSDIKNYIDEKFYIEKWFEYTIEERKHITKILRENGCNNYNSIIEFDSDEENNIIFDSEEDNVIDVNDEFQYEHKRFEELSEDYRGKLYDFFKDIMGKYLTIDDCTRIWNDEPIDGILEPLCFSNLKFSEDFKHFMKEFIDSNYKSRWYDYDKDRRREISSILINNGFTYTYENPKPKYENVIINIDEI